MTRTVRKIPDPTARPIFGSGSGSARRPVAISRPPAYVQQGTPVQAASDRYYCEQAQGYDTYVKADPGGWMTVVPPVASPAP